MQCLTSVYPEWDPEYPCLHVGGLEERAVQVEAECQRTFSGIRWRE